MKHLMRFLTEKFSRWIRLLFGREFPFDDLLALWDILLAEDPALDLVDMVCVAMLLRIRWQRKSNVKQKCQEANAV
jgi:hypothetical protein